jgi:hypothetical protein
MAHRQEKGSGSIHAQSRDFLIDIFTSLRDDLAEQVRAGGPGSPDPEKAARDGAIYEALLDALEGRGAFPDDERAREYVAGLARAADDLSGYEQAALEHRAFGELVAALGGEAANDP